MPIIFTANNLPKRATLWHQASIVLTGNALGTTVNASQAYNHYAAVATTAADGNSFTQSFLVRSGSYTFSVLGATTTNEGKLDWYLDNVVFTTAQDWYSASLTWNVIKTATLTIATDGYHVLKGVINGKHASSTDYFARLTKMWLRQTAD